MNMQSLFQVDIYLQVITSGRLVSMVAGAVGLISIVVGRYALARRGRIAAIVAIIIGLAGMIVSLLHLAGTKGGFGTGSGRMGAIVATLLGLTGTILGCKAFARHRRLDSGHNTGATVRPGERT
jgi:hypothetical protein